MLKISDFGMATVFRHNGRERLLDTRCGTLPYVAPEVLSQKYKYVCVDYFIRMTLMIYHLTQAANSLRYLWLVLFACNRRGLYEFI